MGTHIRALLLLVLATAALTHLQAQQTTGTFQGRVTDPGGAAVPAATLKAVHQGTQRVHPTTSDAQGNYTLTQLPIGTYDLTVESPGFKQEVRTGVDLHVDESLTVNFSLLIGQISEKVEVSAQVTRINTEEGSVSEMLGTREIASIPVNGRNFNQLVSLMPGTVSSIPNEPALLSFNRGNVSANGQRTSDNNWSNDGVYNVDTGNGNNFNDSPPLDSVAEFRVLRGNYDASYGVNGGAQVNIVTKSGTRDLHGSAHEYFRNDSMDARNFFSAQKAPLRFNNPGFTVGGPVVVPKLYNRNRDKTFFFVAMDWQRIRTGKVYTDIVPTLAERQGDFSALGKAIKDPDTGVAFPGNMIPAGRLNANALAYTKFYPAPNLPGVRNFTSSPRQSVNYQQFLARLDQQINSKNQLAFRLSRNNYDFEDPQSAFVEFERGRTSVLQTWGITLNTTISPTSQNELVVGRTSADLPTGPIGDLSPQRWGINIPQLFPDTPANYPLALQEKSSVPMKIPNVTFTGYGNLSIDNAWNSPTNILQFRDGFTKIWRSHIIKAGGLYHWEQKQEPTIHTIEGQFNFNGSKTGDAYADFLLGRAFNYTEISSLVYVHNQRNTFESYLNDNWKVSSRLSVSIGVRYSFFGAPFEAQHKYRIFLPSQYDPASAPRIGSDGLIVPNTGNALDGVIDPQTVQKNLRPNFAPRFSFAWDPTGAAKMVVRGGYGINYSRENAFAGFNVLGNNPPNATAVTVFNPLLDNPGAGASRANPPDLSSVYPYLKAPYYQQWSLGIQRTVFTSAVAELDYVGTKGTNLFHQYDLNQPLPSAAVANGKTAVNTVRPYQGFGLISEGVSSAKSSYNSLQASLHQNFTHGLAIQASYTYAKSLDDTNGGPNNMENSRNFHLDYGPSSWDIRHNFVSGYLWELPWLKNRKDLFGSAIGGWQVSGIMRVSTGTPVDATLGRDIAGVGGGLQRAQAVSDPNLSSGDRTPFRMFRTDAFVAPALGTFSSTNSNILRLPGIADFDFSFLKRFTVRERAHLEFQGDLFNAFNHTQFNGMTTGFYSASFGQATSARPPREIQLGLKVLW